jgi:hypothetical protein
MVTILEPSSVRRVEDLDVDLPYDEQDEDAGADRDVDVEPASGGAPRVPAGSSPGSGGGKARPAPGKAGDPVQGRSRFLSATRKGQAASYVVDGLHRGTFAVSLPRGEDCVLVAQDTRLAIKQLMLSVDDQAPETRPGGLFLDDRGTRTFRVGATLRLAAHQPRRTYRGQFNVTVAWN